MQGQASSGPLVSQHPIRFPRSVTPLPKSPSNRVIDVWQRWRSLHDDILRHVRACDRLGITLTVEQLADELDEARGLVERRVEELHSLQLITSHRDGRVELDTSSQRLCG